jgi:hypothetical protein
MSKKPRPPSAFGRQTVRQATKADLFLETFPVHKKFRQRYDLLDNSIRDRKYGQPEVNHAKED